MNHPKPLSPQLLLKSAGLSPKKSWGQNFLCDESVLEAIVAAAEPGPGRPVVELGAGLGALTFHLALAGGPVVAIERDRELVPLLREYLIWAEHFDLREANALTVDYGSLAAELGGPLTVTGNLPYQLSGRILGNLADAAPHVSRAVLLVQREVAERLASGPGSRVYGLLSVLVQRAFDVTLVRTVAPAAFHPRPKVYSAVVRFDAHGRALDAEADAQLVAAARAAFSARRKTLRNALRGALHATGETLDDALRAAAVDPGARAETLSLEDFGRLGAALAAAGLLPGAVPTAASAAAEEVKP